MAIIKPVIQKLWASGGAVVQPSDTKIETGWTAEVPPHQWENWIQNRQDQYLAHINERGIPEWDGVTDYLASGKSYVQGSDGLVYVSVAASGPSTTIQDPTTDATDTYWKTAFAVATALEAQTQTDNTKQITPLGLANAFKGTNQSLTTNGYQKIPGGLIYQWGGVVASLSGTSITFPITFPTDCLFVIGADSNTTTLSTTTNNGKFGAGTVTASSAVVYGDGEVKWLAVGY